jgi:hypothetical protein
MKKLIDRFLDWLKIKPKPTPKELLTAQLFPEETSKAPTRVRKTKALPSRATRTKQAVGQKATTVAKKTTKKAK